MPARHAASTITIACAPEISSLNGPLLSSPDGCKTVPPLPLPLPPSSPSLTIPNPYCHPLPRYYPFRLPTSLDPSPPPVAPPPLPASLSIPSSCFSFTTNRVEGIIDWLAVWARIHPYRTPCPSPLLITAPPLQPCLRGSRLLSLVDLTDTSISLNPLCSTSTGTSE